MVQDNGKPTGNILYRAPEIMNGQKYGMSSDIYSFVLIFLEMLTGTLWEPPVEYSNPSTYKYYICDLKKRPEISRAIPEELADLIQCCWDENPEKRPTALEVAARLQTFLNSECLRTNP